MASATFTPNRYGLLAASNELQHVAESPEHRGPNRSVYCDGVGAFLLLVLIVPLVVAIVGLPNA